MRALLLIGLLIFAGCKEEATAKSFAANDTIPPPGWLKSPQDSDGDWNGLLRIEKLLEEKNLDRALDAAQTYTKDYPHDGNGWNMLGNAQRALKQYDNAKESYITAIGNQNMTGYALLGLLYWEMNNRPKAIEAYTKLVEMHDRHFGSYTLTRMYLLDKKYPAALDTALMGYSENQTDSDYAKNLALAYLYNDTPDNRINLKTLIKSNQLSDATMQEIRDMFEGKIPIVVE